MSIPLEEAQQMLSIVNAAITEYVQGKRRKSLKLGSHEFMRAYDYVALSWQELITERTRLQAIIDSYSTAVVKPRFRQNTHFPLIVGKDPV